MSSIYEQWQDGEISDHQALRALCMGLGETESEIALHEAVRQTLRDQISHIVNKIGTVEVAGFGKLEMTNPAIVKSYSKDKIEALIDDLLAEHPLIAARIAACRTESARAGSLRITREKAK